MGESENHKWVKLELDITSHDLSNFRAYVDRCIGSGIRFATMSDLGDSHANHVALFELNRECSADIPGRGTFYTLNEYLTERVHVDTYNPKGVLLALDESEWVGMAAISDCRSRGYVFSAMTGVKRSHRGGGIAVSLKVLGVDFIRSTGVNTIRAVHHSGNVSIIALNRKLGYMDGEWDYP